MNKLQYILAGFVVIGLPSLFVLLILAGLVMAFVNQGEAEAAHKRLRDNGWSNQQVYEYGK